MAGAFIQAGMGVGLNVVTMMVFPLFFTINESVGLSIAMGSAAAAYLTYRYRKKIRMRLILPCALTAMAVSAVFTLVSVGLDQRLVKVLLGILFIILSIYFVALSDRIHISGTMKSGVLMGGVAGFANGLFGIGGPPVALYFAAAIEDNMEYVASIQCFFMFLNVVGITLRAKTGAYFPGSLPLIPIGWISGVAGTAAGVRFFSKLPQKLVRKLVYAVIGVSGLATILQALIF